MVRFQPLVVAIALAAAACSNDTTTTPTPIAPVTVTDTFSGTLGRNGATSYTFLTAASGNIIASLVALAPDNTLIVGMSLGTWNGVSCQIVLANDKATQNSTVLGTASGSGSLCVRIYDVGNVVTPITYEIQVNHP